MHYFLFLSTGQTRVQQIEFLLTESIDIPIAMMIVGQKISQKSPVRYPRFCSSQPMPTIVMMVPQNILKSPFIYFAIITREDELLNILMVLI